MLERNFQTKVLKRLRKLQRSWWVKINDNATVGLPDIIGCVNGIFVAIELKTNSKLTEIQHYTLERLDSVAGAESFVATPDNFDEIFNYIEGISHVDFVPPSRFVRKPARIPLWTLPARAKKL